MPLSKRIEKLETKMGITGPCTACGGKEIGRSALLINGVEQIPIGAVGCPRCGHDWVWERVIIELPEDENPAACRRLRFLFQCRDPDEVGAPGIAGAPQPRRTA